MSLLKRLEQKQSVPDEGKQIGQGSNAPAQKASKPPIRSLSDGSSGNAKNSLSDIKTRVQNKLINELRSDMDVTKTDEIRQTILASFEQILTEENIVLSKPERLKMFEQIIADILGYGPLQPLLEDDSITEVMVNGPNQIYVERKGKLMRVPMKFENSEHVKRVIDRIVSPLGRRIDESSPYVDARLPDGSRVNAIIPPISLVGPTLTIRKFAKNPITIENMINYKSITAEAVEFLKAAVFARCNVVISGGTGSGKTTLLNV